ncbi:KH domain-containing protein [Silvibacterium acidisoli]|uniref:KH domain-containing protein n=1 Tax=Acidobacteriaceae bacterium ZG23-2 TaxID=2883246 RepID=UPI00406C3237
MTINSSSVLSDEDPIKQFVQEIVRLLVDDENAVRVECEEKEGMMTLNIQVAPTDTGKLIGKQGRTARSLRTILSAVGMKYKRRYALDILGQDEV